MTVSRSRLAGFAAALLVAATSASALQVNNRDFLNVGNDPIDLGTFDWSTKTFLEAGSEPSDENVIFSNVQGDGEDTVGYEIAETGLADVFFAKDDLVTNGDALTSFTVGYATRTIGPTTFTIRLHTNAPGGGELGASRNFTFEDFPGQAPDGDGGTDPASYIFDVILRRPGATGDDAPAGNAIFLEDGPFAMSFQAYDLTTGPLWRDVTGNANEFAIFSEAYGLDAGFLAEFAFPAGDDFVESSPYLELRGAPFEVIDGPTLAPTIARGRDFLGVLDSGEQQILRFEGLEDERVSLLVRRVTGSIAPTFAVIEQATQAVIVGAGTGSPKARAKVKLPRTGIYEVRISGIDGTAGAISARLRNRPPRAARKPVKPELPTDGIGAEAVLAGRGDGSTLDLTLKTKGDTEQILSPPRLIGDIGEVAVSDYLTQDGNSFEIADLPLPALGGYRILGSDLTGVEETVTQKLKARVRFPKIKKSETKTVSGADFDLVGDWVRDDFITDENSSRFTFDLDRNNGLSRLEVRDGSALTVYTISDWSITPIQSDNPGAHTVQYTISEIEEVGGSFNAPFNFGVNVEAYYHPDNDPDRIIFDAGNIGWRRATDGLPAPPTVSDSGVWETASELGFPVGLPTIVIDCTPEAAWFEIYRAEGTDARPSRPIDTVEAACTDFTGTLRYFDFSAETGTTYRYWVRALGMDGKRSAANAPTTIAPEDVD